MCGRSPDLCRSRLRRRPCPAWWHPRTMDCLPLERWAGTAPRSGNSRSIRHASWCKLRPSERRGWIVVSHPFRSPRVAAATEKDGAPSDLREGERKQTQVLRLRCASLRMTELLGDLNESKKFGKRG